MKAITRRADWTNPDSLGNRMRQARFQKFANLAESLGTPIRILDVGGTSQFWQLRGWAGRAGVHITLLNLRAETSAHENIESVEGDATSMPQYGDRCFDIVFSNSVIEHLFTYENQLAMANEVQRIGRAFWVQTPNYWFPVEPHFHVIGWQWMPPAIRYRLIQARRCGWRGPFPDPAEAKNAVDEVRLMTARELRALFPTATLWAERFAGLVKSWVVYGGFDA